MTTSSLPDILTLSVTDLGFGGDGIARVDDKTIFIPYALPGDVVRVKITENKGQQIWGRLLDVINPSPTRLSRPPCTHCFDCGGCQLQHMQLGSYRSWKQQMVLDRLGKAGLVPGTIHPMISVDAKTRRRATFCARKERGRVIIGFNRHHSDQVIDLAECHVIVDDIMAVVPGLRILMEALLTNIREADVSVTMLDNGLDILITGVLTFNLLVHEALAEFVAMHNVARISWRAKVNDEGDVLLQPKPAQLTVGGVAITPAPGSFLQPSREGEAALISAVLAGVDGAVRVADLFSGAGTLTFPLAARGAHVHAVDADGPGLRAMAAARNTAVGGDKITHQARNLYRDPLTAKELASYDAVVFDPPRAGAKAQAPELAKSGVSRLIAVSCNPASFVTDCAPFLAAGYRFDGLTVVDQFTWSSHVEIVGVFVK